MDFYDFYDLISWFISHIMQIIAPTQGHSHWATFTSTIISYSIYHSCRSNMFFFFNHAFFACPRSRNDPPTDTHRQTLAQTFAKLPNQPDRPSARSCSDASRARHANTSAMHHQRRTPRTPNPLYIESAGLTTLTSCWQPPAPKTFWLDCGDDDARVPVLCSNNVRESAQMRTHYLNRRASDERRLATTTVPLPFRQPPSEGNGDECAVTIVPNTITKQQPY